MLYGLFGFFNEASIILIRLAIMQDKLDVEFI